MANLPESSTFDAGVYQLELTDAVVGGPSGVSNAPLKNLANRTKYLKDHVDAIEAAYAPKVSPAFTGNPTVPTAAQFDADTSVASTEFVQRALGNYRSTMQYTDQTAAMNAADAGKVIICGGASNTLTLPSVASCPIGSAFHFFSQGGITNIFAASGNRIGVGQANYESKVSIIGNEFFSIENVGGDAWCVVSGTPMFKNTGIFGASITNSGYQKLPSGLILQWGQFVSGSVGVASAIFPITFPTACLLALPTCGERSSIQGADIFAPGAKTASGCVFYGSTDADTAASMIFNYIALGY